MLERFLQEQADRAKGKARSSGEARPEDKEAKARHRQQQRAERCATDALNLMPALPPMTGKDRD
eukprot:8897315-Alexandrium_andersonii.AAC.1